MRISLFEKIMLSIKDNTIEFSPTEIVHKERIEKMLEIKLKNISKPDIDLYQDVKAIYPEINYYNFCKDINFVERIIANQIDPNGDPHKVFIRYFISEITKKSIEIAYQKKDAYTMAYAANILGKHNQTDKEDVVIPPFDKIVPQTFEITSDPRVLGIEPVKDIDLRKKQLAEKYGILIKKLEFIEDAKTIE